MSGKKQRIDTSGGNGLSTDNPFAALSSAALPAGPGPQAGAAPSGGAAVRPGSRGRVEVRRVKSGRAGKTVTEISGFIGISSAELEQLGRELKQICGTGGTVRDRVVEIQGDQRSTVMAELERRGFRAVAAGG